MGSIAIARPKEIKKKVFKKRLSGGGSVMPWGGFCVNGIFKLVLVSSNMDSKKRLTCSPSIVWKIYFVLQEIGLFSNKTIPQFMRQGIQKRFLVTKCCANGQASITSRS